MPEGIDGPTHTDLASERKGRWAFDTRLNRVSRAMVAVALTVEVLLSLLVIQLALSDETRNPYKEVLNAVGTGPGEQVVARFDTVRATLFFVGAACMVGVLTLGAVTLWRSVGRGARPFGAVGRMAVWVSIVASLLGTVLLVSASSVSGTRLSDHLIVSSVALLVLAMAFLPAVDVLLQEGVRPHGWEWLHIGVVAVLLVIFVVAVETVDVGAYRNDAFPSGNGPFAVPLVNGFWQDTLVQHPASGFAATSTCGDVSHCAVWGEGYDHRVLQSGGEVTVTADGGTTWRSWLLPQLPNQVAPFLFGGVCTGSTCIAPIVTGGFAVVEIQPDGRIADRVEDAGKFLGHVSCPTVTWCAGASGSTGAEPPALVVSQGPGLVQQDITFPSWMVPAGTSLSLDSLDCPVAGICVMVSTRNAGVERLTPAQRSTLGIGDESIYVTEDGGVTWTVGTLPSESQPDGDAGGSEAIDCPDQQTCWGLFASGDADGGTLGLYRSTNTGLSWDPVAVPSGLAGTTAPRITCGNATSCFLAGQRPSSGSSQTFLSSPGTTVGFRTLDGALTWQTVVLPAGPGLDWFFPSCYATGVCIAGGILSSSSTETPGATPVVILSTDGALAWQVRRLPVPRPTTTAPA